MEWRCKTRIPFSLKVLATSVACLVTVVTTVAAVAFLALPARARAAYLVDVWQIVPHRIGLPRSRRAWRSIRFCRWWEWSHSKTISTPPDNRATLAASGGTHGYTKFDRAKIHFRRDHPGAAPRRPRLRPSNP